MNIKDYLKYYTGCDVIVDDKDRGKLMGGDFMPNSIGQVYYYIHDYNALKDEDIDFTMPYNDEYEDADCRIKPILRRIESLNDADTHEISKIIQDLIPSCNIVRDSYGNIEFYSIEDDGFVLTIRKNGSMDCLCKDNREYYSYPMAEIVHYLLSLGIWLFGDDAFDNGLIIDAATIKTESK